MTIAENKEKVDGGVSFSRSTWLQIVALVVTLPKPEGTMTDWTDWSRHQFPMLRRKWHPCVDLSKRACLISATESQRLHLSITSGLMLSTVQS
jgi:hypothetical protein